MDPTPDISVVVATKYGGQTLHDCLARLLDQAQGRRAEIILVDGSTDGAAGRPFEHSPQVRVVRANAGWLVPQLWSAGVQDAAAPIVALTIGQCLPDANWIEAISRTAAEHDRCAGFGGSIDGPHEGRWRDWAMYFSRYSAYMPPVRSQITVEIAADNAAYRKAALDGCVQVQDGFWETLVHDDLRARGWQLTLAAGMRVQLGPCPSAWGFCRERFLHGRYFGSTRPGDSALARWGRVLTAPALAPFLIARIGSRVARHRRDWLFTYALALPWLVVFMTAWSAGEAVGYLTPRRDDL